MYSPDPGFDSTAGSEKDRRLYVYNGGFLTQKRTRRILELDGWRVSLGRPKSGDYIGVWGQSPTSHRGETAAQKHSTPIVRIEDAFLRSLFPGRSGSPPLGLLIDQDGIHFDPTKPSSLEKLLATAPLDDTSLLNDARAAIARLAELHLTKYTAFSAEAPSPEPGYVLVIDQTFGDASVTASGADRNRFLEMLFVAREENPGARILIKSHPETVQGHRKGYYRPEDVIDNATFYPDAVSPYRLLEGAVAVYTVSSQLGFEAILAGHKPRVFGQPFYAGWGLTQDEFPLDRRQRKLTRAQLFAAAMMLFPKWYDPFRDRLTDLHTAIDILAAETRAWREDHQGWVASDMRLWKRQPLQKFFGAHAPVKFEDDRGKARATGKPHMIWASKATQFDQSAVRVEDGFIRSRGLGAELVPPVSLVCDDLGIYYDPTTASRLEHLIRGNAKLRPDQSRRARKLIKALTDASLTKYNVGGAPEHLGPDKFTLVVGQVEDDASIVKGAGDIATNAALLTAAREARPNAKIVFKPHPDVEAGLRAGKIDELPGGIEITHGTDIAQLFAQVEEIWTMTSLSGFEALLRGVRVVTTGAPFYAGWGLTDDRGEVPPRRREDISLEGLVHATLIDYPRYVDPKTGAACPVEVAVERLASGAVAHPGLANRLLAKIQGLFASQAHLWR